MIRKEKMKIISYVALACLLGGARAASAQTLTHDELLTGIQRGDRAAILEAGNTGDITLIPALKEMIKPRVIPPIDPEKLKGMSPRDVEIVKRDRERPVPEPAKDAAKMALAKLGVKECLDEILTELTDPTNAPVAKTWGPSFSSKHVRLWVQMEAAKKLAYIKDRSTVKVFVSLLSGKENPEDYIEGDDVTFRPPSELAMETLPQIVDNPPRVNLPPDNETHDARVKIWQQWWEQNKDKYP